MAQVHPTAIVDAKAQLAPDVSVGPHCIIEGDVTIGQGARLIAQVYLKGPLTLGARNLLYPGVCIGFEPQWRGYDEQAPTAGVRIGEDNILREGVTIHRASQTGYPTAIGNHNYLMNHAHLGHDATVGNRCTLASGSMVGGLAIIEDLVTLGGNAAVHQKTNVGRLAMIGGNSGSASNVPPFCVISGINNVVMINAVGLRRAGVDPEGINQIRWAFDTFYLGGHTAPKALDLIDERAADQGPAADMLLEFAAFIRRVREGKDGRVKGMAQHSATGVRHALRR